jgi:hypothetical protein
MAQHKQGGAMNLKRLQRRQPQIEQHADAGILHQQQWLAPEFPQQAEHDECQSRCASIRIKPIRIEGQALEPRPAASAQDPVIRTDNKR